MAIAKYLLVAVFAMFAAMAQVKAAPVTGYIDLDCDDDPVAFLFAAKQNGFQLEDAKQVIVGTKFEDAQLLQFIDTTQKIRMLAIQSGKKICVVSAEYYDKEQLIRNFRNQK